ncbi:MAG: response regulator transcription factor [Alphaproteobacteria bacterium]|nr:MAG: response regulator transcription factor [Alphaproteobacteria bacterium]
MRVLLVEDNPELVSLLKKGLAQSGFSADSMGTVGDALHVLATMKYAAVVLDLGLPDEDGLVLLRDMRRRHDTTPVLVLTARDGVSDRVTGLREGADDYLLRRPGNLLGRLLTFGNVSLDTEGRQVFVDGIARAFPARETAVLEILLRRGGNVAPKRLFEDQLFGLSGDVGSNAVEVYVHRLRKMLGDAGAGVRIHTVRGVGYLMAEEKAE